MRTFPVLLVGVVVVLLACLALTQAQGAESTGVKTVATVMQLMEAMIIPSSNAIFDVGRNAPETDEDWTALRNHAVILSESGNLLMLGSRAKEDDEVWMSTSRALVEAGEAALEAALAQDVEAFLEAGNLVIDACEICHETHL